jgi:hypothetical protein
MRYANILNQILELRGAVTEILSACDRIINEAKSSLPDVVEVARDKKQLLIPSHWPRVGGREFNPTPTDLFGAEVFRAAYTPSGLNRLIYVGACQGLANIASVLHLPLYKVSTCASDRLEERMKELRIDKHGAVRRVDDKYVGDETGWANWFPSQISARALPSPNSPVRCQERSILVALPAGLTPEEFDRAFDAEVAKGAIDRWLMTPEGLNHAAMLKVDPALGQRLTAYPYGDKPKLSPSTEIVVFCTRISGPDRLIAIAEGIILRHLGLID